MFFIFFISPLTLVKPLPVTERTQLLYKAHRCVPRPHPYTDPRRFFDDTRSSFRFVPPLPSRLVTTNPISSATELDPSDFLRSRGHGGRIQFSSIPIPRRYYTLRVTISFLTSSFILSFLFLRFERERERTIKINTIPPIEAYLTRTTEIPVHGPLHAGASGTG